MRAAMVRNTRAVVALKLPRRQAATIRVDGSEGERAAYQELAAAARRLAAEGASETGFALHHLPAPRDRLGRAARRRESASPTAMPTSRAGTRWRSAGRPPATAARRRHCSTCCGAIGRKEAGLRPLPRDARSPRRPVGTGRLAFARFEGGLSGPGQGRRHCEFRESVPVLLCNRIGR